MNICRICNRPLTSAISIQKGIGPNCIKYVNKAFANAGNNKQFDLSSYPDESKKTEEFKELETLIGQKRSYDLSKKRKEGESNQKLNTSYVEKGEFFDKSVTSRKPDWEYGRWNQKQQVRYPIECIYNNRPLRENEKFSLRKGYTLSDERGNVSRIYDSEEDLKMDEHYRSDIYVQKVYLLNEYSTFPETEERNKAVYFDSEYKEAVEDFEEISNRYIDYWEAREASVSMNA